MSLLADLLSKTKSGSPHGGTEKSPLHDIPPTLSKSHGISSNVRRLNNRYVIISLVCLAFIAIGAFVTARFGLLKSSSPKITALAPKLPQQPAPAKAVASVATPPAPIEQAHVAKITLGEPTAPESPKRKTGPHKAKNLKCPPPQVATLPKPGATRPAQKIEPAPVQARQKAVAPLKIDTAARDSLLYAARSAEQISDWRSALANYRKAQEIDPGNYKIMSNASAVLNNLGMFDAGVQEAEQALAKKPDYVPALINAAIGYSSKGNTQKALRLFTYASAIDPGNRSLVINLGVLYERSGNLDDALSTYRQLAGAGDPLALQGMGRVYERKGNRIEAIRAYRQILKMPNASPTIKREVKGKLERLEES